MRAILRAQSIALVLALAACEAPEVQTSADRVNAPLTTTLSGQVVLQGPTRGDVLVLLYDAAHPPAPLGTGHPRAFVQVPAGALFQSSLHDGSAPGPFSASYTFPTVPPGQYLVGAFLDSDACLLSPSSSCRLADFDPFYLVTREPNGGDLLGGHLDAHGTLAPVTVPVPDSSGQLAPVTGVQVVLGGQPLPDRPAFSVAVDPAIVDAHGSAAVDKQEPTFFALQAAPLQQGPVDERQPAFLVRYVDDNHDGQPDLSPQGVPLLWPKVYVRKIADPDPAHFNPSVAVGLRDENDLNDDGVLDPTGKSYDHADPSTRQVIPADAQPDLVVLAATYVADPITNPATAFVPTQLYAQLADANGAPDMTKVVPVQSLKLALLPRALDASGAQPVPLAKLPAGRYAVIVEQYTGQTWRLPNELSSAVAGAVGLTPVASQGFTFTVAP